MGKFNASAADRWMYCGGSVVVDTSHLPVEDKPHADRGSLLHKVSEVLLRDGDGEPLSRLCEPDQDQVQAYVDFVSDLDGEKTYEACFYWMGGRAFVDCLIVRDLPTGGHELEIIDAKFGTWYVSPFKNYQLGIYGRVALQELGALYDFERVRLTIAQPACDNFSSWPRREQPGMPVDEFLEWSRAMPDRVDEIKGGDAEFAPDPDNACKFCRAKSICPGLAEYGKAAAREQFAGVDWADDSDPSEEIQAVAVLDRDSIEWTWENKMEIAKNAIAWANATMAEVKAMLLDDPDSVPGFKVVEGRKKRDWSSEGGKSDAADFVKEQGFTEDDCWTDPQPEFKSPAQLEKLFKGKGSGDKKEALAKFQVKHPGTPTIVPESDPRPAMDRLAEAKNQFREEPTDG